MGLSASEAAPTLAPMPRWCWLGDAQTAAPRQARLPWSRIDGQHQPQPYWNVSRVFPGTPLVWRIGQAGDSELGVALILG